MSNTPLTDEIVKRIGDKTMHWAIDQMVQEVLDGVREYDEQALGEFMAGAVAILYGQLAIRGVSFSPDDIIDLARQQNGASN